jgi:hypothetical protein
LYTEIFQKRCSWPSALPCVRSTLVSMLGTIGNVGRWPVVGTAKPGSRTD